MCNTLVLYVVPRQCRPTHVTGMVSHTLHNCRDSPKCTNDKMQSSSAASFTVDVIIKLQLLPAISTSMKYKTWYCCNNLVNSAASRSSNEKRNSKNNVFATIFVLNTVIKLGNYVKRAVVSLPYSSTNLSDANKTSQQSFLNSPQVGGGS